MPSPGLLCTRRFRCCNKTLRSLKLFIGRILDIRWLCFAVGDGSEFLTRHIEITCRIGHFLLIICNSAFIICSIMLSSVCPGGQNGNGEMQTCGFLCGEVIDSRPSLCWRLWICLPELQVAFDLFLEFLHFRWGHDSLYLDKIGMMLVWTIHFTWHLWNSICNFKERFSLWRRPFGCFRCPTVWVCSAGIISWRMLNQSTEKDWKGTLMFAYNYSVGPYWKWKWRRQRWNKELKFGIVLMKWLRVKIAGRNWRKTIYWIKL